MLANCDVIVIFPIYGQFRAIRKPDSEHIVFKTYIFINTNLFSYKNWKQPLTQLSHSSHIVTLGKGTTFAKKCWP